MISRRHIRIKGMQALYANLTANKEFNTQETLTDFYNNINQTKILLVHIIFLAKEICEYAIIDGNAKGSKFLPTKADLNLSTSISQNSILIALQKNENYLNFIKSNSINAGNHSEFIRSNYFELVKTDAYKNYIQISTHSAEDDQNIFLAIIQQLLKFEEPIQDEQSEEMIVPEHYLEDVSGNFLSDLDSIIAWFEKHKNKIGIYNYSELLGKEKREFGEELIHTFIEKNKITADIITPKLINWDAERIAMMDKLILQLGITELLYFTNIPTKVTINEYIDIAKLYSTPQSGQFVNGVLDKIHKELLKENKIHKTDFKFKKKSDA
jgi:transcription antitermination protein NusB